MDDLFVVSPPRCMSTIVQQNIVRATYLHNNCVDGNEYLNSRNIEEPFNKRHKIYSEIKPDEYSWNYSGMQKRLLQDLIDDSKPYIMKDVLYPNVVSEFVKENEIKTIIICKYPPLAAYSIVIKEWAYIMNVIPKQHSAALLYDMVWSVQLIYDKYLINIRDEPYTSVVHTKKLKYNHNHLWDKVERLGYDVDRLDYITDFFKEKREDVEKYKHTRLYSKLKDRYENDVDKKWVFEDE